MCKKEANKEENRPCLVQRPPYWVDSNVNCSYYQQLYTSEIDYSGLRHGDSCFDYFEVYLQIFKCVLLITRLLRGV